MHNQARKIRQSAQCGCTYCLSLFHPSEIKQWVDPDPITQIPQCPLCPYCGIDAVESFTESDLNVMAYLENLHRIAFE